MQLYIQINCKLKDDLIKRGGPLTNLTSPLCIEVSPVKGHVRGTPLCIEVSPVKGHVRWYLLSHFLYDFSIIFLNCCKFASIMLKKTLILKELNV